MNLDVWQAQCEDLGITILDEASPGQSIDLMCCYASCMVLNAWC